METDGQDGESSPLLMALGAALNTEIKLVVNCKIRSKKKNFSEDPFKSMIILLAKAGVYLFKKDLLHVKFNFEYKNVKYVKLENSNPNSLMIFLEDVYMDKVFIPHIYLSIPDRDMFLNTFSCYYSTYYANYFTEVREIKIVKVDLIEFENDVPLDDKFKVVYNQPPNNYRLVRHRNYSFFLPIVFQETGNLNYTFKISHKLPNKNGEENNRENLNASQLNVSNLNNNSKNNGSKSNLNKMNNSFIEKEIDCEFTIKMQLDKNIQNSNSQNNMLRLEMNTYTEFINIVKRSHKTCKLFIYKDCPYIKKYNLADDSSYWECWQIEALMVVGIIKKKLIFFNLRRKYIPPFFDTLSDFSFLCKVDLNDLDDLQFIDFKAVHPLLYEMVESVVDSVHPDVVPNYIEFATILEMKFDSLSLDYHSFMYYTQNLKIFGPETYHIGLKYALRLMEIIKSGDFKAVEQKLKFKTEKCKREEEFYNKLKYFEKVYEMLKKRIQNYLREKKIVDEGEFGPKMKYGIKEVFPKFKNMLTLEEEKKKVSNLEEAQGKQNEISKNWQERICVFLYFLLDGGIGSEIFDLEFILSYVTYDPTIKNKICEYIFPLLLKYYDGEQTSQQIKEIASNKNIAYNEILLCKMIKYGSLELFFSSDEEGDAFVVNLIKEKWNLEILEAFYDYLDILVQNDGPEKKRMENLVKSELKKVLVNIYSDNSLNPIISIVVCKIICFMCRYDSLGGLIEALINMNILEIIARKINTFDYILLILNLSLLNLITAKINEQGLSETICNERFLLPELNKLIVEAKFYDNPAYLLKKPVDILLDILLSKHDVMQEKFSEEIKSFPNNNIPYNLVHHFLTFHVDYRDIQIFFKKCLIQEKIFHFFNCLIKLKSDIQKYFIENINIMESLSELFSTSSNAFEFYLKQLKIKREAASPSSIQEFVFLLRSILRMCQFIFFLFENNRNYMDNVKRQFSLINLLKNMLTEINSDVVKNIVTDPQNYLKDYESIIFSLQTLIKSTEVADY